MALALAMGGNEKRGPTSRDIGPPRAIRVSGPGLAYAEGLEHWGNGDSAAAGFVQHAGPICCTPLGVVECARFTSHGVNPG
jgi:hypothetical protein